MSSPLELLKSVISLNQDASPAIIGEAFSRALAEAPDREEMTAQIVAYWVEHFRLRAISELMPREERVRRNETRKADREIAVARAKREIVETTIYLNLLLPSGTPLSKATGAQCKQAGGFFSEIARRVKSREIVGNVLSEADVADIWNVFTDRAKRAA